MRACPGDVHFFTRVSAKLVLDLKKPFRLVNMVRVDETPIHDAVREALVNCLVNSDFYEPRGVVIDKYLDQIIIKNPGNVIVGKQQMLRGGESEPRNGNLMKMFNLIGYGERAGSGVPDIYATWEEAGYAEPVVEEKFGGGQPNRTIVTLPLFEKGAAHRNTLDADVKEAVQSDSDTLNGTLNGTLKIAGDQKKLLIALIKQNSKITRKQMAGLLDVSERTVQRLLNEMPEVYFTGGGRSGHWEIKLPKP